MLRQYNLGSSHHPIGCLLDQCWVQVVAYRVIWSGQHQHWTHSDYLESMWWLIVNQFFRNHPNRGWWEKLFKITAISVFWNDTSQIKKHIIIIIHVSVNEKLLQLAPKNNPLPNRLPNRRKPSGSAPKTSSNKSPKPNSMANCRWPAQWPKWPVKGRGRWRFEIWNMTYFEYGSRWSCQDGLKSEMVVDDIIWY